MKPIATLCLLLAAAPLMAVPVDIVETKTQRGTGNTVVMETSLGTVVIELYPDKAPKTVANFLGYVQSGHYDGTLFHRVIPNFMVQGGGFTTDMNEKQSRDPVVNESANGLENKRGTLAVARAAQPDSGTCQFFINLRDNAFLDRARFNDKVGYCVFGKVIEGMDVVDKIATVKTGNRGVYNDVPVEDVVIKSARVAK